MILKIVFIYYSQAFVFWDTLSLVKKFLNWILVICAYKVSFSVYFFKF